MVVGAVGERTDLAVIGGGPGGYVAALRAADAGLDVTLIDDGPLGGVCLNVGCIPSKALIELADLRQRATHAAVRGLSGSLSVDMATVAEHLRVTSTGLRSGVAHLLDAAGVNVVAGRAHFAKYDRLSIETGDLVSHLEFDNAIVATGSRPIALPAFPVGDRIVDSTGALALTSLPATMAIIGGGYIGVELGTAFAKLGVAVTIIEADERILPALPDMLSRVVARQLKHIGVTVHCGERADRSTDDGLRLASGAEVAAEIIVVAVGRRPNSDTCSLTASGAELSASGHVVVDGQCRAARGIYAIGDLTTGPALAHKASAEAEVAVEAITGSKLTFDAAAVPAVVFSDPEVITVGVTPEQAARAGYGIHRFPHSASARAATFGGGGRGLTVLVADEAGTVVGVHAVGPHVSELAGEACLAIEMAATIEDLSLVIHPHPTMSETLPEAAFVGLGRPLHFRS